MRKIYLLLFFAYSFHSSDAQCFQRSYAGLTFTQGEKLFLAPDSGYYLFADTSNYGSLQITKTDKLGDSLWTKFIPLSSEYGSSSDFCQTFDKGYAIAYLGSDSNSADTTFILKLDSLCNQESLVFYSDTNVSYRPRRIIQTVDSCYLITGSIWEVDSPFAFKVYTTKITRTGTVLWNTMALYDIDRAAEPCGLIETSDHYYVLTVSQYSMDNSPGNKIVMKLDTAGNIIWTYTAYGFFPMDNAAGKGVVFLAEADNGYLLLGNTAGHSWDVGHDVIIKIDTGGNYQWTKSINSLAVSYHCISPSVNGGFFLTGSLFNPAREMIVTRVDDNADSLYSYTFPSPLYLTWGNYVTQLENGTIAIIGTVDSVFSHGLPSSIYLVVCDSSSYLTQLNEPDFQNKNFYVFPNPSSGNLTINSTEPVKKIKIFNAAGVQQHDAVLINNEIDVEVLPPGVYFIQLQTEKTSVVRKFVKQ